MTVIPKPASTVVLMDHLSRVYLTQRPKTMKFLGGYYVFPGGAVEPEDYIVGSEYIINHNSSETFSVAHYVAAARELFEEVGIFLGTQKGGRPVNFTVEQEMEYRRLLLEGKVSFLDILTREQCFLNLSHLQYFGYRLTPKGNPARFDTRFFLAKLPDGQSPKPDLHEVDDAFWVTPEEALALYEKGELPMVSPTVISLRTLVNHQQGEPLMMPERQRRNG
ncbi:NUDIX hydrolase [Alkalihalobacterium elongatum]|uniref:NUDIX hydrolase n=1 Tax=Alkalihalobacterium elongatum TaxID=2675466 RepID=UPI001C1F8799|nr:NUDIX hydrolase [Alkalihalobacterium elongatum]